MYGAPAVDGVTVKATLDGRGTVTTDPDGFPRYFQQPKSLRPSKRSQSSSPASSRRSSAPTPSRTSTPGDRNPLLGWFGETSRIYGATGFSGGGFKNATGYGHIAAYEALGKGTVDGLDFVRPERFKTS